jgi:hypothetical protein
MQLNVMKKKIIHYYWKQIRHFDGDRYCQKYILAQGKATSLLFDSIEQLQAHCKKENINATWRK